MYPWYAVKIQNIKMDVLYAAVFNGYAVGSAKAVGLDGSKEMKREKKTGEVGRSDLVLSACHQRSPIR